MRSDVYALGKICITEDFYFFELGRNIFLDPVNFETDEEARFHNSIQKPDHDICGLILQLQTQTTKWNFGGQPGSNYLIVL